jgi:hypothetical protein
MGLSPASSQAWAPCIYGNRYQHSYNPRLRLPARPARLPRLAAHPAPLVGLGLRLTLVAAVAVMLALGATLYAAASGLHFVDPDCLP